MIDIIKEVEKVEKELINWRRELHKIPEIGLDLPNTVSFIKAQLDNMNIEYRTLMNGNAIVALIKGIKDGKTIALRADMDALPITEETGLEFASTNGCMHACGHDGHTAILLAVAKVLNENKNLLNGNVKLLFQPGEEYPGGAEPMIREGAMENPKVDAVIGLHLGSISKEIPFGKIGISYGALMAAVDIMDIKIKGRGSHGAYPHLSIDPIVTASEIVLALQNIVSREVNPVEPAVVSVTKISSGFNHNIIPDMAEIKGTIRTVSDETRERISKRIEEIVKGICLAHGTSYELNYEFCYPAVINNERFTKDFVESAKKVIKSDDIVELKNPVMGAEDMSYFLREAEGTFFFLSNPGKINGEEYPHHNPKFDIDESQLSKGASIILQATIDWLNNN